MAVISVSSWPRLNDSQLERSLLVFPAASKPSIRIRISFVPKIFPIILDTWPPILATRQLKLGGGEEMCATAQERLGKEEEQCESASRAEQQ